ncbi:flagellar biosynthesis protein FlhF [Roseateles paludis]|uniref:Flagellar biosynthesis protein FlhF n=1 Tax=Roseateles paludis TaxID=3145238 RepID=A0ABV0G0L9_9BURK
MNMRKFTARSTREALAQVKEAFGPDAVVLSNKSVPGGVEIMAMAPEGLGQIEQAARVTPATPTPAARAPFSERASAPERRASSASRQTVGRDVEQLAMSTLSFQDYVRERMLRRRDAELRGQVEPTLDAAPLLTAAKPVASLDEVRRQREARAAAAMAALAPRKRNAEPEAPTAQAAEAPRRGAAPRHLPVLRDEIRIPTQRETPRFQGSVPTLSDMALPAEASGLPARRDTPDMMNELRQVRGLIEERFNSLAFMEKLQRQPVQARLTQKLLELGFSPALTRKLADACPSEFPPGEVADEQAWAQHVLVRNVLTDEAGPALEDRGGVFALIGSTGVGKTTTTAKLAAHFATKHGASQLGLITLDAYRVGAHEQLRAYGRILGVPVHTAHDRASLDDLLELLANKKLVLIDTAGMAQRDSRTHELLEMLAHPRIKKVLVLNAAQQGETIEDVVTGWKAAACEGVVLSKIDEAVKLAPVLDTLIRHRLKILGVANGQRVPEDWHRLSSADLVQRALRSAAPGAWRLATADVNLIFAGAPVAEHGLKA